MAKTPFDPVPLLLFRLDPPIRPILSLRFSPQRLERNPDLFFIQKLPVIPRSIFLISRNVGRDLPEPLFVGIDMLFGPFLFRKSRMFQVIQKKTAIHKGQCALGAKLCRFPGFSALNRPDIRAVETDDPFRYPVDPLFVHLLLLRIDLLCHLYFVHNLLSYPLSCGL